MDLDVARQARDLPEVFAATARHWTWAFASPTRPEPNFKEKVPKLLDIFNLFLITRPEEEEEEDIFVNRAKTYHGR